jgi:hypothetical protein
MQVTSEREIPTRHGRRYVGIPKQRSTMIETPSLRIESVATRAPGAKPPNDLHRNYQTQRIPQLNTAAADATRDHNRQLQPPSRGPERRDSAPAAGKYTVKQIQ